MCVASGVATFNSVYSASHVAGRLCFHMTAPGGGGLFSKEVVPHDRNPQAIPELTLDWLAGFENSKPVRVGNAACGQLQWDVYGELIDAMFQCRVHGIEPEPAAWNLEITLIEYLEQNWNLPDHGIWEVRGPRQHFTHSKVMAWVALDRAIKSVERLKLDGPIDRCAP